MVSRKKAKIPPSKNNIYHLKFFSFQQKQMNLVAPKNEITTVGKTLL